MTRLRTHNHGVSEMDIGFIDDEDDVDIETSIEYINQIIEKIKSGDDADVENCGLRPIRELLQNADDAQATFMVFRFDKDRLWVYNNGASMKMDYLQALSTLGGASKKEVADTSGSFGTGFRATHMFTDTPEIEWVSYIQSKKAFRVNAKHMTLKLEKWKDIEGRKNLPQTAYMKLSDTPDVDNLGVFFSFPWRTQNTTGLDDFGEYLWPASRICELATELRERIGPMLFGCRHLKTIRIVLTCECDSTENFVFDASVDTDLIDIRDCSDDTGLLNLSTGFVKQPDAMFAVNSDGMWGRDDHAWYTEQDLPLDDAQEHSFQWSKREVYKNAAILDDDGHIELNSKRYWNLCVLLLPLSTKSPKLPKYTPIPLGGLTNEQIGIVTFCPPAENRREIDTASNKTKTVIDDITSAVCSLYASSLKSAMELTLSSTEFESADKESILISMLPKTPPGKWLNPSSNIREGDFNAKNSTVELRDTLRLVSESLPLAHIESEMVCLKETVHTVSETGDVLDERIAKVLRSTQQPVLSSRWSLYYEEVLKSAGKDFRDFIWETFLYYEGNQNYNGSRPIQNLDNFLTIVKDNLESLSGNDVGLTRLHSSMLDLAKSPPKAYGWDKENLPKLYLIRDGNGLLLTLNDAATNNRVVVLPPKFSHIEQSLKSLIGEEILLHSTNKQETIGVLNSIGEDDVLKLNSVKLIEIVDASTKKYPAKHQHLSQHDGMHEAVSVALVTAVNEGLSRNQVRGKRFMPVLRGDSIQTMEENTLRGGQLVWLLDDAVKPGTASQAYHRDFVFKKPDEDTYASMPDYLKWRLRFLEMHSSTSKDDISRVVSFFSLNEAVNSQGKATNLIRTLLTDGGPNSKPSLNTPSIFKPGEFSKWQPQHGPEPIDGDDLVDWFVGDEDKEKLQVLIWLLKPYDDVPKTLGHSKISNVPYLPTHDGKWITPSDASTCTDKELLELIGRSSSGLHPELVASLHTNVLKGLGVSGAITIEQAQNILHAVQAGRNTNRGLIINLLRHFFEFFDCKNESNKHLYAEFSNQTGPWVPVGFKDFASLRAANEAYWPNEEYDSFLRMHILDPETIPEEISDSRVKELQKFFGFATKLRAEDALQLLDANRPSQLADEVDFETLQKYIATNGFTTQASTSDLPEAMLILDSDGQEHRVPKGSVLATVAKKKTFEKMLTSAEAIPVFAHNEFSGGKKFCERLIEIGFCKEEPGVTDLIRELGNPEIAAGPCSEIWRFIGKMDASTIKEAVMLESEEPEYENLLMYASKNSVYSQTNIALNNGEENPLLDGGNIQLVLDAKKLPPSIVYLLEFFKFEDFREISPEVVLEKATEAGPYDIPEEDFDRVKRLVLNSENQLFGILQGVDRTFRLVNVNSLNDYIMLDQHKDLRYSILNTEKWLIHPLDDAEHAGRLANHALLFSQTNPEINPLLDNLTSTPNTAMGEAISTYLGEDSNLEWDESQQHRFSSDCLKVEMVQGSIPRILHYRFQGQHRQVRLGGLPNFQKVSEDEIHLYLSRDLQQCGPKEVARLVEKCLQIVSVEPYNGFVNQLSTYLANPQDGRDLFESNQARETANTLRHHYGGCQIESCRLITPYTEGSGALTAEKRKSIIGNRATFYRWEQSINANYPIGQNIWLCPRHHTLWERGLIRIEGLHDDASIKENADKLEEFAENFEQDFLDIRIYDGDARHDFNPKWNEDKLVVAKAINQVNHGKAILASLVDWAKHRLNH